jgi:hypothetical protein
LEIPCNFCAFFFRSPVSPSAIYIQEIYNPLHPVHSRFYVLAKIPLPKIEVEQRWSIVEMQRTKQNYLKDRSVYYASFPIQEQAKVGNWDYQFQSVYFGGILDFVFEENKDDENRLPKSVSTAREKVCRRRISPI